MNTEQLKQLVVDLDESYKADGFQPRYVDRTFHLAVHILHRFMGDDWLKRHVISRYSITYDYFKAVTVFAKDENNKNTHRVIRVAEMLFNFQDVQGFSRVLKSLKTDHKGTEQFVSELEAAAFLYAAGIPFMFVESHAGKGGDYDVEIKYPDGWTAAADVKCKVEGTGLSVGTIRDAVRHARGQLPNDKPCFVLMKVPDDWPQHPDFEDSLNQGLDSALRQTQRITTVFVWWEEWITLRNGNPFLMGRVKEIENNHARFEPGPVTNIAQLTHSKAGKWIFLPQIIVETIEVPQDGSVTRVIQAFESQEEPDHDHPDP